MLQTILLYIPLSVIGLWRWSYWLVRVTGAQLYRRHNRRVQRTPAKDVPLTVTVVTPVYNEDEALFKQAMESWIDNGVNEIIAVIDKTNTRHIVNFERTYVPRTDVKCRLIVTPKPGKRAALCDGIEHATGDLIALVDSDTIWSKGVRGQFLPYFADPQMGGVTVAQRISNPNSVSNVLFDILLWNRYHEEVPFLLGLGNAYNTLSGRTAVYRRQALLNDQYDNVHSLTHEFFVNARAISGDDKRLSHLILEQGWKVDFAPDAVVYTQGMDRLRIFLKQRLRWTRNSWRADLRAVKRRWVFRYPVLAYFMIDRFVQPFLMLLGPTAVVIAAIHHQWLFVSVLLAWWCISRTVRLLDYFRQYPRRIVYLPAYILYSYTNAILKIYALMTILENSWATRWHKSRMRQRLIRRWSTLAIGIAGVAVIVAGSVHFVTQSNKQAAVTIPRPLAVSAHEFAVDPQLATAVPAVPKLPASATLPTAVHTYVTQPGDTLSTIALRLNVDSVMLKKLNGIHDPDKLPSGLTIMYYTQPATAGAIK
jgi:cellulose synthase/poly-beta-1,6-N-acetylglucosamine synthase-like glycosyltransferase/LysM repeat protein